MTDYCSVKQIQAFPRLPLEGSIDLTYRCNNACRHCWTGLPLAASEGKQELSFDEIVRIAEEARALGCRKWNISGGEPMVRPDFSEIFEFLTRRFAAYSLNTNGTLITPAIAQLMKRTGNKLVALYGATAEVYDHVTRNLGGFEQAMQGIAYLKEAGAGFTVQLVPMRDNRHQWEAMIALAEKLSPEWRMGASWLHFSASGSSARNSEIAAQRLDPSDPIALDLPESASRELIAERQSCETRNEQTRDALFAACIDKRRDFHIDPYGGMTFCYLIKDPTMRYDLRQGSFVKAWDEFIPSLADKAFNGRECLESCASCESMSDCTWCAAYGYLENRRFSSPVPYLCDIAHERRKRRQDWQVNHCRYFKIAGITIEVESELPLTDATFHPKFLPFQADGPGDDQISFRHCFRTPDLKRLVLGKEIYRKPPWAIYQKANSWIYKGIYADGDGESPHQLAVFNRDHTRGRIYHYEESAFLEGNLESLTLAPTDQILLARLLAGRQGCYLHSSGVVVNGCGMLFVGNSEAGKSTMVKLLQGRGEILCDDRIIVRRWPDGFRIHGTWSHGEMPQVSGASALLRAVFFLKKSSENKITLIDDHRLIVQKLLPCIIKPLLTADWWEKSLELIETLSRESVFYEMEFDMSGAIVPLLEDVTHGTADGR